jgi:chemotaxis protein CheD
MMDAAAMEHLAPARYFDREMKVESVKILPGQYHAARGEGSISTVLGSCVSSCLWDPMERIGGMNHFMLPGETQSASPWGVSARFGVYAMEVLINEMLHQGADRRRLVAKVFGGARVLQGFDTLDVGTMNSRFVLEFLQEEGIPVAAQDLLGASPRKLHFFPATGKVQVKKLHLQPDDALQRQERDYLAAIARQGGGEVEIFRGRP